MTNFSFLSVFSILLENILRFLSNLKVALQILGRKFYKHTKKSSKLFQYGRVYNLPFGKEFNIPLQGG